MVPVLTGAFVAVDGVNWYVQKDPGNVWQAQATSGFAAVDSIEWGDNLNQAWRVGAKIRVETVFLTPNTAGLYGYDMLYLSGSGTTEVWGSNGVQNMPERATVYSTMVTMEIRQVEDAQGNAVDVPILGPQTYRAEVNVGGRVIYGGQWDTALYNNGAGVYNVIVTESSGNITLGGSINHGTIVSDTTTSHLVTLTGPGGGGGGGGGTGGGGGGKPDNPGSGGGGGNVPDSDGDGLTNNLDNCVETYNPDQLNYDGDEYGDACDTDIDNDGVLNADDPEPYNPAVPGDPTEPTPTPVPVTDTDGDGLSDADEATIWGTNPRKTDTDNDKISDYDEVNGTYTNKQFTDPLNPDHDGDGVRDGKEIQNETDPFDPNDPGNSGKAPKGTDTTSVEMVSEESTLTESVEELPATEVVEEPAG